MKGDGHNGGELLLTEKGKVPQRKASTRNQKFTMIGLTSFSGDPVMCILIIEGKILMDQSNQKLISEINQMEQLIMKTFSSRIVDLGSTSQVEQSACTEAKGTCPSLMARKCQHYK